MVGCGAPGWSGLSCRSAPHPDPRLVSAGMIREQLRCGVKQEPRTQIDVPCGRVMSDVSSMFIVYLLELYRWAGDTESVQR